MIEAGAPSTGSRNTPGSGVVPATPGAVMVALPEVPRNAERAQSEGRVAEVRSGNKAANNTSIIKAGTPPEGYPGPMPYLNVELLYVAV